MSKSLRTSLKHWVGKVFKNDNKPKKFLSEVARKITTCDLKESKNQLEDIIANYLYLKIQELKTQEASFEEAWGVIEQFLNENELNVNTKLQSYITQHLEKYINGSDEHSRNYVEFISTALHEDSDSYDCVCPKATRDLQVTERTEKCYRCFRDYHTNCLWPIEDVSGQYECPLCFLRFCLPNRRVSKVLFGGYLRQTKKDKIQYLINLPLQSQILQQFVIEARCVRLSKESRYELTWPQNCNVLLNRRKIGDFKPLPASSSIKRRVDEEIILEKKLLTNENTLVIEEKHQYIEGARNNNYNQHFVIIAAVEPLSGAETQRQLQTSTISVEQSKMRLRQYLDSGFQDCIIDRIKVPLKCHFYGNKITIPVRSKHCLPHYQPFDLKGFILANITTKYSTQRWKCPICKKRAYDLQVDEYLLKIILSQPSLLEIYFNRQGQLQISNDKINDKDQPSLTTNASAQVYIQEEHCSKSEGKIQYKHLELIKKEGKNAFNQSSSCQEIALEESEDKSDKSKILFQECIELSDQDELPVAEIAKPPKRSYRSRAADFHFEQIPAKLPKKRNKKQNTKIVELSKESISQESSSVQPIDSQDFANCNSDADEDVHSPYSDQDFKEKPNKKKKGRRSYHRERVGVDEPVKNISKMTKTLVPSPSIRTVIPEVIRITDTKIPEPKKGVQQQQAIEIADGEEQSPEAIKTKKFRYHLGQLQKQKCLLVGRGERSEVTESEQSVFLSLCESFILSMHRG